MNMIPQPTKENLPHSLDLEEMGVKDLNTFLQWYEENQETLQDLLNQYGGLLLRDTYIRQDDDFAQFSEIASKGSQLNYASGNSPRSKVLKGVYTSTEFPADRTIAIHNELSYTSSWPAKIYFCSILPAETGGETPLANSRMIYENLPEYIRNEFEQKGVAYIRNLHGGNGVGVSWMDTFETTDPAEAEDMMRNAGMEFRWTDGTDNLWIRDVKDAVITHPVHGCKVWFNQADEFHPSSNGVEMYQAMLTLYGGDTSQFPLYAQFGDGTDIPLEYLDTIRKVIDDCIVTFPWQKGDLLLLDNIMVGHGRRPFTGKRRTLVAMSN
ncbi:TauD/TfdA family dioxygenase [Roseivirga sp. BDSF3-8]|uniref:TauD/TfdA family dioxygenase n=1 Tax=Roseivirga sp. BDSF3-8 TaxID=3241598 RepID=UPI0035327EF9